MLKYPHSIIVALLLISSPAVAVEYVVNEVMATETAETTFMVLILISTGLMLISNIFFYLDKFTTVAFVAAFFTTVFAFVAVFFTTVAFVAAFFTTVFAFVASAAIVEDSRKTYVFMSILFYIFIIVSIVLFFV